THFCPESQGITLRFEHRVAQHTTEISGPGLRHLMGSLPELRAHAFDLCLSQNRRSYLVTNREEARLVGSRCIFREDVAHGHDVAGNGAEYVGRGSVEHKRDHQKVRETMLPAFIQTEPLNIPPTWVENVRME